MGIVKDVVGIVGAGFKSIINRRREKRAKRKAAKAAAKVSEAQSALASKLNLAQEVRSGGGKFLNEQKPDFGETPKFEKIVVQKEKGGFFSLKNILLGLAAVVGLILLIRRK